MEAVRNDGIRSRSLRFSGPTFKEADMDDRKEISLLNSLIKTRLDSVKDFEDAAQHSDYGWGVLRNLSVILVLLRWVRI